MNKELDTINMNDPDARADLALLTKDIEVLKWFIPDVEPSVRLNIIKNPLFNRDLFTKIKYDEYELNTALLKTKILTRKERKNIQEKLGLIKQTNKINKSFCPLPWNHLGITTNGDIRACCQMIYKPYGMLDINVKDVTNINSVRNLSILKNVRKEMLSGKKPKLCNLCWLEEDNDLKSKRIHQNMIYSGMFSLAKKYTKNNGEIDTDNIPLNYLDLRLGNKCNLRCRSCGPTESDQWYKDCNALGTNEIIFYDTKTYKLENIDGTITINTNDFNWPQATNFLDQILDTYKNINRLYFTGGEPTINIPHIQFLEKLIDKKMAKHIYLEYNSNGMAMPERLLNIWKNFDGIGIGFSIDGIDKRFEYLRYPGKWNKFINTLKKLDKFYSSFSNFRSSLAPTISIYNFIHMLDMQEFVFTKTPKWFSKDIPIHVLEGPDYMSAKILPNYAKEKIKIIYENWFETLNNINIVLVPPNHHSHIKSTTIKSFTGLLNYLNDESLNNEQLLNDFYIKTEIMDKQRNQNWKETFPELNEILINK